MKLPAQIPERLLMHCYLDLGSQPLPFPGVERSSQPASSDQQWPKVKLFMALCIKQSAR